MTVLVADAAQNAMSAEYKSVSDGLVLVSTLVFWNYTLDWLSFRFTRIRNLVEPPPLRLVRDGKLLWRNMRRELISEDEVMKYVRQSGTDDLAKVREAFMESDGRISVILKQ